MSAIEISDDILKEHVLNGIDKWRKGDLYMMHGLGERDRILDPGVNIPDKSEKGHPFNIFIGSVATDFADTFSLDKRERKGILRKLQGKSQLWQEIIAENGGCDEDKAATPNCSPIKKKAAKTIVPTRKALPEVASVAEPDEFPEEIPEKAIITSHSEIHERQLDEKRQKFEKTRDLNLIGAPSEVKERFGKIVFAKWGKHFLPSLIMSPYEVAPGGVKGPRTLWLEMNDKLKASKRMHAMSNLIYWYGSSKDPVSAYSFFKSGNLVTYEDAVKRKLDQLPVALQKKIDAGETISMKIDQQLVEGLKEMKEDLKKDPKDRYGWIGNDWIEEYDIKTDEEDDTSDEIVEEPTPEKKPKKLKTKGDKDSTSKKKLSKKRKKRKDKDDEIQEKPAAPPRKIKSGGKKRKKEKPEQATRTEDGTVEESSGGNIPAEAAHVSPGPPRNSIDDIGDADISSNGEPDDDYKYAMADSASNDEKDDEELYNSTTSKSLRPKHGSTTKKDPPKKKENKVKIKIEKGPRKEKKNLSNEKRKKVEQKKFTLCEERFGPILDRWKKAIKEEAQEDIFKIYSELLPAVSEFSVSFITGYHISPMMKQSKAVADNQDRKKLMTSLKEHYLANKGSVPDGFVPRKMKAKEKSLPPASKVLTSEKKEPIPEKVKAESQDSSMRKSESQESVPSMPSTLIKRVGSLEKVGLPSEPESKAPKEIPVKVERKKKFSLGTLMRPSAEGSKAPAKNVVAGVKASASSQLSQRQQTIPHWITGAIELDTPTDDTRGFALEFLQQAAPFIPHVKHVNHNAIARALEASIYEWSHTAQSNKWVDKYWEKIDDIVVAISGDKRAGTIAALIAEGKFQSPDEIVRLSEDAILDSFYGKPMIL